MLRKNSILFLVLKSLLFAFLLGLVSCARQQVYVCGHASSSSPEAKVLRFEKVRVAEKSLACISGVISETNSYGSKETLPFVLINLVDSKSGKEYESIANVDGAYELCLPKSVYELRIRYLGYYDFILRDLVLNSGDVFIGDIMLVECNWSGSAIFYMQEDGTIVQKRDE